MSISDTEITSFKQLYLKHYKIQLTDNEAVDIGTRLLNFMNVVGKKLPLEDKSAKQYR